MFPFYDGPVLFAGAAEPSEGMVTVGFAVLVYRETGVAA